MSSQKQKMSTAGSEPSQYKRSLHNIEQAHNRLFHAFIYLCPVEQNLFQRHKDGCGCFWLHLYIYSGEWQQPRYPMPNSPDYSPTNLFVFADEGGSGYSKTKTNRHLFPN